MIENFTLRSNGPTSPWYSGTCTISNTQYHIQVAIYDNPSQYGIMQGRISKITIFMKIGNKRNERLIFDRGYCFIENLDMLETQSLNLTNMTAIDDIPMGADLKEIVKYLINHYN